MRQLIRSAQQGQIPAVLAIIAMMSTAALASPQAGVASQPTVLSTDGYGRILDAVFPHESVPSLKVAYTMVLRFEPNQGPESQLLLRVWRDGHTETTLYTVRNGSVWNLANAYVAQKGEHDVAAIAGSIPVEKKQLEIDSAKVDRWRAQLFETLRASDSQLQKAAAEYARDGSRDAVLDGTRYELWYSQGETDLHWAFSDIDMNDLPARAHLPLARWMNAVHVGSLGKQ